MHIAWLLWALVCLPTGNAMPKTAQQGALPLSPSLQEKAEQSKRVPAKVMQERLIHWVQPVYPPLARQARIQGTVRLQALIGKDGSVLNLQVIAAHPLLTQAALDAVRQWRYQPLLLEGQPVEVVTTVDVAFSLESPQVDSAVPPRNLPPDVAAFLEGNRLTQAEADAAEKTLEGSPEDVVSHAKLIWYYFYHDESGINWEKHLFWLIDHHPESVVFDLPFPITYIVRTNAGQPASPELLREFKEHWEQAAAAHPKDAAVLLHTAMAVSGKDSSLGLAYARKAVKADPKCTRCRNMVGAFIGSAILRLPANMGDDWTCLPKTPEVEQTVSELRKEIESSTDPEIILDAGMTIRGYSGVYGSHCGGKSDEAAVFGMELIRKAVGLDPSLIDRRKLQDLLKSSH